MSAVENMRKIPRQSRAQDTVDVVLEAAAQVLEASGDVWLTLRTKSFVPRATLHGALTDGRRSKAFSVELPATSAAGEWAIASVNLGSAPRGDVALVVESPCAAGYAIDAVAVGAKPGE